MRTVVRISRDARKSSWTYYYINVYVMYEQTFITQSCTLITKAQYEILSRGLTETYEEPYYQIDLTEQTEKIVEVTH